MSIFMSMFNDIDGKQQKTKKFVCQSLEVLLHTREDFLKDTGHSSDRDRKKMVRNAHKCFVERCG